jgi:ABC-type multidrug transport system ATPase subunit
MLSNFGKEDGVTMNSCFGMANQAGDTLELPLPAKKPVNIGSSRLHQVPRLRDYPGQPERHGRWPPTDLYATTVKPTDPIDLGIVTLPEGKPVFKVTITGKESCLPIIISASTISSWFLCRRISMLECRNIHKHYGGVVALKGVSWKLLPGEVHALCGENGAGKSTLARILCGITAPDEGEIFSKVRPVAWTGPQAARQAGLGIILQELDLFAHLSIAENLAIGNARLEASAWVSPGALHDAARPLLRDVGLELDPALPLDRLSVSQWQLVAIARVLGLDAKIIFMDEPTSALTDDAVERLFGLIRRLKERGVAIVYVSHKMSEIFRICDRVSVMRDGEMIGTEACAATSIDQVIQQMVGRAVATTAARKISVAAKRCSKPAPSPRANSALFPSPLAGAKFSAWPAGRFRPQRSGPRSFWPFPDHRRRDDPGGSRLSTRAIPTTRWLMALPSCRKIARGKGSFPA